MNDVPERASGTLERTSDAARLVPLRRKILTDLPWLTARMNAAIHVGHEFSANSDIVALVALRTAPALRARDLTARTGMTRAGTTNMIDRLERAGFAERSDVDDDHRGVLVALTPVGIDAVDAMTDRVTEVYLQNAAMFASWGHLLDAMDLDVGPLQLPAGSVTTRLRHMRRAAEIGAAIAPLYHSAFGPDVAKPHHLLHLLLLATEPGGTRPASISQETLLSSASTSDLLRLAEDERLVTRTTGRPPDRRVTIVTATDRGRAAVDAIVDNSDDVMRAVVDAYFSR
jgi:DNA-binding MarR family transcriptional regulator